MADSDTYYCADAQLYAGKVGSQCDVGQGMRVVLQLPESISDRKCPSCTTGGLSESI